MAITHSGKERRSMIPSGSRDLDSHLVQGAFRPAEIHSAGPSVIVGRSAAVRRVLDQIERVAPTDATVLLLGETGTGKELFATRIHELSARASRAMVRVNCAAIPSTLMESELFGCERGAFTDAVARRIGRFELANQSTIFLDEIGDLPSDVQVKLLRVLEERKIERLGSPTTIPVDVRIIAATHRDLEQRIEDETFREDLFYRLNVFPIRVPPLRERLEDIPALVWRFVEQNTKRLGKQIDAISADSMASLREYSWPGNIRELRNCVERAMIVATGSELTIPVPPRTPSARQFSMKLLDVQKEHIRSVLQASRWRIRGAGGAADQLGLRPTTLETRMAKLGLCRPKAS
jgi:formate hydrogenlyase transcriptional activator